MYYFDSAATAPPCGEAVAAAAEAIKEYANPSSLHFAGRAARGIIESARESVARGFGCAPEEVIFTSGGSEGNCQCIFGAAKLRARAAKRIVTTDSEHPSVSEPLALLEKQGFEVVRIPTRGGRLDEAALAKAFSAPVAFASIMLANNETGAVYDIPLVRGYIEKSRCGALLHCDAVQGFLKTDVRGVIRKNCDLASVSAHKVGGLKGVGAVYAKKGVRLPPFVLGGGQERGLRSGTENTPGIAAFGAAVAAFTPEKAAYLSELNEYTRALLSESLPGIRFNLPEKRTGAVLSVSVPGAKSEVMLNALSMRGFCVSAGSACHSKKSVSETLRAFGLSGAELEGALRISFSPNNTKEECALLAEAMGEVCKRLIK